MSLIVCRLSIRNLLMTCEFKMSGSNIYKVTEDDSSMTCNIALSL